MYFMDAMIDQIKGLCAKDKAFCDTEIQVLGAYLVGQVDFKKAAAIVPKSKQSYYSGYYNDIGQISKACKREPALVQRLGRHLALMLHINRDFFIRLVSELCGDFTTVELFLAADLTYSDALAFVFEANHYRVNKQRRETLEAVYGKDSSIIEKYAKRCPQEFKACVLAFLIAKDVKKHRKLIPDLLEAALYGFACALDAESQAAFAQKLDSSLAKAYKKISLNEIGKLARQDRDGASHLVFLAIRYADGKIAEFNQLCGVFCQTDYASFFNRLSPVLGLANGVVACFYNQNQASLAKERGEALTTLREFTGLLEIDPAYLCAWCAKRVLYMPLAWKEAFDAMFGDAKLFKQAAALAHPAAAVYLGRRMHDKGAAVSVSDLESAAMGLLGELVGDTYKADMLKSVQSFLMGGAGELVDIPFLKDSLTKENAYYYHITPPEYDFDVTMAALQGISPVPDRWIAYITYNRVTHRAALLQRLLCDGYGLSLADAVGWMLKNADQKAALIGFAESLGDGGKDTIQSEFVAHIIKTNPALVVAALPDTGANGRLYLFDTLYETLPAYDPDFLIACLGDKSKKVREHALSFLLPKKDLIEKIRPLVAAKKKDVREAAEKLMLAYEGSVGASESGEEADLMSYCTRNAPKTGAKAIAWAIPGDLPKIRWRENGEYADDSVVLCYLYLFLGAKSIELPVGAKRLRDALNEEDIRAAARMAFEQWLHDGAVTKNKGALLLLAVHADNADILALQKQIDSWAEASRGALASEAVRAMALGGSNLALMTVDSIGRKFKNKQVRRAGQEAFAGAATALGLSPEVLGDRIIPTLGFDERGEKTIDYGARKFIATLSPTLSVELTDETGKAVKSLPKPSAKDDEALAEKAKKDFAALKKSLKAVVSTQQARLEAALASSRKWESADWQALFVKNPILHSFAIGLIWGAYDGEKLTATFRYMEDGSFTNADEDDFDFAGIADSKIGLVHPLDLSATVLAAWRQQLADYEVTQPICQMERPVYAISAEEKSMKVLERFAGKKMLGISLLGKLQKLGWFKGSVQDAGCFSTFFKEEESTGTGVQLNFTGMYVSPDPDEVITIGQAAFYKAGSVNRGSYVYDDVTEQTLIPLCDVPPRVFSEIVYDLTLATVSSTESNPNWRGEYDVEFAFAKKAVK